MSQADPERRDQLNSLSADPKKIRLYTFIIEGNSHNLADLVMSSGLPRRIVQDEMDGLGAQKNAANKYSVDRHVRFRLTNHIDDVLKRRNERIAELRRVKKTWLPTWLSRIPKTRQDLDHVQATVDTIINRCEFLLRNYDVEHQRFLFLGDHDLTSLALAAAAPDAHIRVLDIDANLLDFLYGEFRSLNATNSQVALADFRLPLHPFFQECCDVVFTDPPYTPEGVSVFLRRAISALDRSSIRPHIIVAYGYSHLRPDTGAAVQRALLDSGVAINAVLPEFNVYHGAEAIGSRGALYVCDPLPAALKSTSKGGGQSLERIYTHGKLSVESSAEACTHLDAKSMDRMMKMVEAKASGSPIVIQRISGSKDLVTGIACETIRRQTVYERGISNRSGVPIIDMREQHFSNFSHIMLSLGIVNYGCFMVLGGSAEISDIRRCVHALYGSLGSSVTACSTTIVNEHYSIITVCVDGEQFSNPILHWILTRPHGRLSSVWRDGIVALGSNEDATLTKNQARAVVENAGVSGTVWGPLWSIPMRALADVALASSQQWEECTSH